MDFQIKDRKLVKAENMSGGKLFPPELVLYGITYVNNLDNYWVRFEGFGAQSFYDIRYQEYPVEIH